jgi:hypothetical protein
MSASFQSSSQPQYAPDVLFELLHTLSQPLTTLRCSLELSIDEDAETQQRVVSGALQQTDKVIGMIQLMREYLDAERPSPGGPFCSLAPVVGNVVEELSSIAAVRGISLRLVGTCAAEVPVAEQRLRLALQYLMTAVIEVEPAGGKIMLLLGEGPTGTVLRVEGSRGARDSRDAARAKSTSPSTLRRVRLSIASRILEAGGASLVLDDSHAGFVLRVPRQVSSPTQ